MDNNIYNNSGTIVFGNVIGSTIETKPQLDHVNTSVCINDPEIRENLLHLARQIQPVNQEAARKAKELQDELEKDAPKVGKVQALYDWLRRNCTVENTLNAVKVFGSLLIQILK